MQAELITNDWPSAIQIALFREEMLAEGRYNAFVFVSKCRGDIACVQEKIAWYEDVLSDTNVKEKGHPFALNTSVRLHAEGFLAGLKDALEILTTNGESSKGQPRVTTEPSQPTVKRRKAVAEKGATYVTRARRSGPRQRKT